VYEAVDAAVPILGFPLFYDQPRNVGNLVDAGMALSMDLLTVNKIEFLEKINKLINDKKLVNLIILINSPLLILCLNFNEYLIHRYFIYNG